MRNVAAANAGNHDMIELLEVEQTLIRGGADRVCSGPTVCDSDGTHRGDRQGSCKLEWKRGGGKAVFRTACS